MSARLDYVSEVIFVIFSVLMACYFRVFFQCGPGIPFSAFAVEVCTFRVPKGSPADIFL